jgi:hypothetical protein
MWALLSLKTCFNFKNFLNFFKLKLKLLLLLSMTPARLLGTMRIKRQKVMGVVEKKIS